MRARDLSSERGAVLMQVILAMAALVAMNIFVADYGVMWVGRTEAQNAADAGAMAGAIALAYDDFNDRTATGAAKTAARAVAQSNGIWGEAPVVNVDTDVTFPATVTNLGTNVCAGTPSPCVRVDIYRNGQGGSNPLPMLFGSAAGLTTHGVKAMAIAQVAAANASDCLKPWAIPDKWLDNYDTSAPVDAAWTDDDTFDTVDKKGKAVANPDVYVAPTANSPGTGFTLANDLGIKVTLKTGNPHDALAPGVFGPVQLPLPGGGISRGGADYRANIAGCNSVPIAIGDSLGAENGDMIGPTKQGVGDLIALDPNAEWDPTKKSVINSCAQASTPCAARSPRIVAIPIFDTGAYYAGKQNGNVSFKVVNILGFFIDDMQGKDVVGYFTTVPALRVGGSPSVGNQSGFASVVMLVR